jgi:hypothetical protein
MADITGIGRIWQERPLCETPNPPLGVAFLQVPQNARAYLVHAVLTLF